MSSKFMKDTQDGDFCMIYDAGEKFDEQFYVVVERHSGTPFSLTLSDETNIYYYFNYHVPQVDEIASHIHRVHRCRSCTNRVSEQLGYSGVDGFAVDLSHPEDGPYKMISALLDLSHPDEGPCICALQASKPVVIVSVYTDKSKPREAGKDPEGQLWKHLGFNPSPEHCTGASLAQKIAENKMLLNLTNGTIDTKMAYIFGTLNVENREKKTDLDLIEDALEGDQVLRKEFWKYRLAFLRALLKYAKKSKFIKGNRTNWTLMNQETRMHLKMFAILYGGPSKWTSAGRNIVWNASGQVLDLSKDADGLASLPGLMNSRSDPDTYMRRQIAIARQDHGATFLIYISLAWATKDDFDVVVVDNRGNVVYFGRKKAGGMSLKFDKNAYSGGATTTPVESVDLLEAGVYTAYVTLYTKRSNLRQIPFTLTVSINGVHTDYEEVWDYSSRGIVQAPCVQGAMSFPPIEITQKMIDHAKNMPLELTNKEANRLSQNMPGFKKSFGDFTTAIATNLGPETVALKTSSPHSTTLEDGLAQLEALASQAKMKNKKKNKTLGQREDAKEDSLSGLLATAKNGTPLSMIVNGRGFAPTYVTTHSCPAGCLTSSLILSTFQRNGQAPMKPDKESKTHQCSFDEHWINHLPEKMCVTHITPMAGGYFLTLGDCHLPAPENGVWVVAGGMYVSDLSTENHQYRDIWDSLHTVVRPKESAEQIGIGIFVHSGTKFTATVNGVEKSISV